MERIESWRTVRANVFLLFKFGDQTERNQLVWKIRRMQLFPAKHLIERLDLF